MTASPQDINVPRAGSPRFKKVPGGRFRCGHYYCHFMTLVEVMLYRKAFSRFLGVKYFIVVCPLFWLISDINNIVGGIDQATLAPGPVAA